MVRDAPPVLFSIRTPHLTENYSGDQPKFLKEFEASNSRDLQMDTSVLQYQDSGILASLFIQMD